jgi:hypothetical protein
MKNLKVIHSEICVEFNNVQLEFLGLASETRPIYSGEDVASGMIAEATTSYTIAMPFGRLMNLCNSLLFWEYGDPKETITNSGWMRITIQYPETFIGFKMCVFEENKRLRIEKLIMQDV